MNCVILLIDTSQSEKTVVRIEGIGLSKKLEESRKNSSQILLPLIDSLLKESGLTINDITEIKVHTGPGSYTGLRVGVSVAKALGRLLGIPVNGQLYKDVVPIYKKIINLSC